MARIAGLEAHEASPLARIAYWFTKRKVGDELRKHLDERQLVELTSCIAWENYRARFDHALGIESEGFTEGGYCPLPVT